MAGTVSILDFPEVTTLEDNDVLYLLRGTGVDRDKSIKGSTLKNYLGDTLLTVTASGSVNLSNYTNNVVIVANPSANIALTVTGYLPGGNKLLIINVTSYDVAVSIISTNPTLKEQDWAEYISSGTAMEVKTLMFNVSDLSDGRTSVLVSEKAVRDAILAESLSAVPIGVPIPVFDADVTFIGESWSLPDRYVYLDGGRVSDAESAWDGYRVRNLNQGEVVISLTFTADAGGSYATVQDVDILALNVGDLVSGTGIASGTLIKAITRTSGNASVVTLTDVAASGAKTTTFTGKKRAIMGGSDSKVSGWNRVQSHAHYETIRSSTAGTDTGNGYTNGNLSTSKTGVPVDDGLGGGTPRTGADTIPDHNVAKYIMRHK